MLGGVVTAIAQVSNAETKSSLLHPHLAWKFAIAQDWSGDNSKEIPPIAPKVLDPPRPIMAV
jgi:hypothetical protein